MTATGDPPNPDDRTPPERVPVTITHRLIGEKYKELCVRIGKLVFNQRSRIRSQSKTTIDDIALDVFQSTVIKVIEYQERYDPALPFEAWFHGWAQMELNHHLQKLYGRSRRHQTTHFGEGAENAVVDHRAAGAMEEVSRILDLQDLSKKVMDKARALLKKDDYELFIEKFFHLKDNNELARARNTTKQRIAVQTTRIKQAVAGAFPGELLDGVL